MTLGMLKQNIKTLNEAALNYQNLLNKKDVVGGKAELKKLKEELEYFKNYITILSASIQKLIKEEKDGLEHS